MEPNLPQAPIINSVTPTVSQNYQFAGFFVRAAATFIDLFALLIPSFLILTPVGLILKNAGVDNKTLDAVLQPLLFVIYITAVSLFLTKRGATPGKIFFGMKIIDSTGNNPSLKTVLMREVVGKIISGLFLNLGFFWAAFDSKKQGIHDKIANTHVIFVRSLTGFKKVLPYIIGGLIMISAVLITILILVLRNFYKGFS